MVEMKVILRVAGWVWGSGWGLGPPGMGGPVFRSLERGWWGCPLGMRGWGPCPRDSGVWFRVAGMAGWGLGPGHDGVWTPTSYNTS